MKITCKVFAAALMIFIFNQMFSAVLHQSQSPKNFNKAYFEFQAERQRLLKEDEKNSKKNLPSKPLKKKLLDGQSSVHQIQPLVVKNMQRKSSETKASIQLTPASPKVVVGPNREKELAAQKAALELRRRLAALELAESSNLAIKPGSVQSPYPVPSIRKSPVIVERTVADDKSALDRQYAAYQKLNAGLKALELAEASRLARNKISEQSESDLRFNGDQIARSVVQPALVPSVSVTLKKPTKKSKKLSSTTQTAAIIFP